MLGPFRLFLYKIQLRGHFRATDVHTENYPLKSPIKKSIDTLILSLLLLKSYLKSNLNLNISTKYKYFVLLMEGTLSNLIKPL